MNKIISMNFCYKKILLFILLLSLVGCGFHMGSKTLLSPKLDKVYFQADNEYEPLAVKFKNELSSYGIILAAKPADAPYTILFLPTKFDHTTSTAGPSTQARVYDLTYTAAFEIKNSAGKTIVPTVTVSATRSLTMVPNEIFEISTQVGVTKTSMEQELLIKLFNVLSSRQITEALEKNS